jgi:glycosyltransferase involved in cell wall biosynthesis
LLCGTRSAGNQTEKIELLSSSVVYVSNSAFEGFGIPLVEAMAAGDVHVASDIEGHRSLFQDDNVGYLVKSTEEVATEIADLLNSETERLRLATNGRRLVEQRWIWAKVAQRHKESLLRDALPSSWISHSIVSKNAGADLSRILKTGATMRYRTSRHH